jgi:hypothetical protein
MKRFVFVAAICSSFAGVATAEQLDDSGHPMTCIDLVEFEAESDPSSQPGDLLSLLSRPVQ